MTLSTPLLSPEKRRQILEGAAAVFAADGYEGASMSRIALAAGVSKGTLYNYFGGKSELFAAYVEQACDTTLAHIYAPLQWQQQPDEALRSIAHRMIEMITSPEGLRLYRMVVAEAGKFPELSRIFYNAGPARSLAQMSAWLAEQARLHRLRINDPAFAAEQFFALCHTSLSLRCRLGLMSAPSEESIARIVDASVAMFLATYGTNPETTLQDSAAG